MIQHERAHHVLLFSTAQVCGGGEVYVEKVATGLHDRFRMSVLANQRVLDRIQVPVDKYRLSGFPRKIEQNIRGGYRLKELYYCLRHGADSILSQPDVDLVHFQNYDAYLLKFVVKRLRRQGIPSVITIHTEFDPERVASKRPRPNDVLEQLSAIICVCNATKENVAKLGVSPEKCHVIYNGVDIRRYVPSTTPGEFVTWIGRVDERDKNAMLFVHIAELAQRRNLEMRFRIVGDGPLLPSLLTYAERKQIRNLEFLGWQSDMPRIYSEARVVCLTSTSEGLPLVAAEAMSSGVPVVATNVGGIRELIVDDSVGSVVGRTDAADFLQEIYSLFVDDRRYSAVRRGARVRVENMFSLDRMLHQVAGLYDELLP